MTRPGRAASVIRKRSLTIAGHRTSVSLEDVYWEALHAIAAEERRSVQSIVRSIDEGRTATLSSSIRTYVLNYYRNRASTAGAEVMAAKLRAASAESKALARDSKR